MKQHIGKTLKFKSQLVNWAEGMDYCALAVPESITKKLGTKAAVLVMASINGCEKFQVSLFPAGEGKHFIRVRSKVRKQADLNEGDKVSVEITVLDRSHIDIPNDLALALKSEKATDDFMAMTAGKKIMQSEKLMRPIVLKHAVSASLKQWNWPSLNVKNESIENHVN